MNFEGIRKVGISIFASAGVAGLIIGLAAQKVIGSVLAGLQIDFTQPIRLDDVVVVEASYCLGSSGDVAGKHDPFYPG